MRWSAVTLIAALSAWAAHADDPLGEGDAARADWQAANACIDAAGSMEEATECVGITVQGCVARRLAGSNADKTRCLAEEKYVWRQIEQALVIDLLKAAHVYDMDSVWLRMTSPDHFQKVLGAEAAWGDYLGAQCRMEVSHYGAGTAAASAEEQCIARQYVQRIFSLKTRTYFPSR